MSSSPPISPQRESLLQDPNSPLDNAQQGQQGSAHDNATEQNTRTARSVSADSISAKSIPARFMYYGPVSANGNGESSRKPNTQSNADQGSINPGGISVDAEAPSGPARELLLLLQQTGTAESSTSQAHLAGRNANGHHGSSQRHNARDTTARGNATEGNTTPDSAHPTSLTADMDAVLARFQAMDLDMRQTLTAYRSTSQPEVAGPSPTPPSPSRVSLASDATTLLVAATPTEATQPPAAVEQVDASTQTEELASTQGAAHGDTSTAGTDAATQTEPAAELSRRRMAFSIARRVVIPALKQNPDSMVEFIFPCLSNSNGQPGGWTEPQEEDVAAWCAQAMLQSKESPHNAAVTWLVGRTPVAHLVASWEYASEWQFARRLVVVIGILLSEGLAASEINAPSTVDITNWLRLVRATNILRKFVYMQLGDALICQCDDGDEVESGKGRDKGKGKATEAGVGQAGPADEAEGSAANAGNPGRKRKRKRKRGGKKAKGKAAEDGVEQSAPEDEEEGSDPETGEDQSQESDGEETVVDQGPATAAGVERPGPVDEPGECSKAPNLGKNQKYKPRHKRP
ncbi:hypothetical protein C8A01DRAFT_39127 [Parachaetomium inaequale]|uniref:Uncharacterized protein n=1 Tax=Parachaetomium inaequale TaxID=2588326 RepID=A0AAN6PDL7_9PEZI|nr:hypothetical protein C8A01DRAFT_39127 [Parachaetomium inaequale]